MKYRWKLLILLMSVSILPVLLLRTFGSIHFRQLEKLMIEEVNQCRESLATTRLRTGPNDPSYESDRGKLDAFHHRLDTLAQDQLEFSFYLMAAIAAVAAFLALVFSRTISKRLQLLIWGVHRLSEGKLDTRIDFRFRDEFNDLARAFNRMGSLVREHMRIEYSLSTAEAVQHSLLPVEDPDVSGLDVSGTCRYCEKIGGDYYDYLTFGEQDKNHKFGIVIADVAGHGISSALLMASARALIRERAALPGCTDCDLSDINRHLYEDMGTSGRFITLFYCEFDLSNKTVRWIRAGHPPVMVYDPSTDCFHDLAGPGVALGVLEHAEYKASVRPTRSDQVFVFASDGILETRNSRNELFGKDTLCLAVRNHAGMPAKEIRDAVLEAAEDFRGDTLPQEDDMTLIIVKMESQLPSGNSARCMPLS